MAPADPCAWGGGGCPADVFGGVLDGVDVPLLVDAELVVVPELGVLELLELVAVPGLEQPARVTTVVVATKAATRLDDFFTTFLRRDLWLRHGRAVA